MGAMARTILGLFDPRGACAVRIDIIRLVAITNRGFQEKLSNLDTILMWADSSLVDEFVARLICLGTSIYQILMNRRQLCSIQ